MHHGTPIYFVIFQQFKWFSDKKRTPNRRPFRNHTRKRL
jgi:hypothetical protein